jgi:hypothetical protein
MCSKIEQTVIETKSRKIEETLTKNVKCNLLLDPSNAKACLGDYEIIKYSPREGQASTSPHKMLPRGAICKPEKKRRLKKITQ